jgi:inner membrane protein
MPSSIGHALVATAIGAPLAPADPTRRYWIAGILCAVLPDLDAVGRPFGWGDFGFLGGHRALTHSIFFAVVLGVVVALLAFRDVRWRGYRGRIIAYLVLATASHGALDAFAAYGDGVEFFAPLSAARYAAPWRPLDLLNEIVWIWFPAVLMIVTVRRLRTSHHSREPSAAP